MSDKETNQKFLELGMTLNCNCVNAKDYDYKIPEHLTAIKWNPE